MDLSGGGRGSGPVVWRGDAVEGVGGLEEGEEKLEVDEEGMEEEMMLQGMKIMEERRTAFGAEELTVEQGFRPLAW